MNNRDEALTPENIDERIEQLTRFQREQMEASTPRVVRDARSVYEVDVPDPLARTARDLLHIYDEDQRLEHAWERISQRMQSTGNADQSLTGGDQREKQSFQGEQKTMSNTSPSTHPGSFQETPEEAARPPRRPRRNRWLTIGAGLAAAVVVVAIFVWTITGIYQHAGTHTGSGGPVATPTPAQRPAPATPTPTPVPATPTTVPGQGGAPVPGATPTPMPSQGVAPTPTPTPSQGVAPTPTPMPSQRAALTPTPTPMP